MVDDSMVEEKQKTTLSNEYINKVINESDLNLFNKKEDIIGSITDTLISRGFTQKQIDGKIIYIGRIIDTKQFYNALKIIKDSLKNTGTSIDCNNYDGLIVKKLSDAEVVTRNKTNKSCGQTDFRPVKEQENIFPYLVSSEYYKQDSKVYNSLKNYYLFKINVNLYESNLDFLKKKQKSLKEDNLLKTHTTVLNDYNDRLEISSQYPLNGQSFNEFRNLLYKDDYLIILKRKESFDYDFFGLKIKNNETGEPLYDENRMLLVDEDKGLINLNKRFYYLPTITLITEDMFDDEDGPTSLDLGENRLLYGVPGAGKSWKIKNEICSGVDEFCMERVVFHPDYTYSDFVGQILPKVSNDQVKYEFVCGPFTTIMRKAYSYPSKMFYLIIEEINRGNAPAIFGDIFQLLDRMDEDQDGFKKGTSEFPITNSDIAEKVYEDKEHKVRIPSNLSIIATMNTSDQNVFTLDTAFQRRWNMEMIENKIDDRTNDLFKESFILDTGLSWKKFCYGINKKILENNNLSSSEDKRLGTYFIKSNDFEYNKNEDNEYNKLLKDQSRKFSEKVLKYLWDDAFKFSRNEIFNEEKYSSLDAVIKEFNAQTGKERFNIFKDGLYDELINIDFSTHD